MHLHHIKLVQTTFPLVNAEAQLFAMRLYNHLFGLDPSLCSLFPREMGEHNLKFMAAMAEIVNGLERPYFLIYDVLKPLGRKHASHPIQLHHYHTFAAALRLALLETLGETLGEEAETAWMEAYYLVVGIIKEMNNNI